MLDHADISAIPEKNRARDLAYLRGERQLTVPQLESLSRRLHLPMSYFLASAPPDEDFPILQYRTLGSTHTSMPSRELIDTITHMDDIQSWIQDQRLDARTDPLDFVGSFYQNMPVEDAADQVCSLLGVQRNWFTGYRHPRSAFDALRDLMSDLGVTTILGKRVGHSSNRPLLVHEFRAFAMCDSYAPLIFINANDTEGGQLFSLLHEFVHICLGMSNLTESNEMTTHYSLVSPEEQFCNAVAGEVLVPRQSFVQQWAETDHTEDLFLVCQQLSQDPYSCSVVVIARRALDLNLISPKDYCTVEEQARKRAQAEIQRKKSALSQKKPPINQNAITKRNLSERFIQMVAAGVASGTTTFTEAFRLTGTTNKSFFNLVEMAAGITL